MSGGKQAQLSRRERQIMNAIYRRGAATASEVHDELPDAPSYSAVRAMLRILEEKGHLTHSSVGTRYVYAPVVSRSSARQSALRQVVRTFFEGSATKAVATLIDMKGGKLTPEELQELSDVIERARKEER